MKEFWGFILDLLIVCVYVIALIKHDFWLKSGIFGVDLIFNILVYGFILIEIAKWIGWLRDGKYE